MAEQNNAKNSLQLSEEDIQSELKLLKNSWDMYEATKKQTVDERTNAANEDGSPKYSQKSTQKTLDLIDNMQNDIKKKYLQLGGKLEDLLSKKAKKSTKKQAMKKEERAKIISEIVSKQKLNDMMERAVEEETPVADEDSPIMQMPNDLSPYTEKETNEDIKGDGFNVDPVKAMGNTNTIKYDNIPLPSKGECYPNKNDKIPVAYLTAYDENMIMSPNMYKDGQFLDHILKAKIMTNEIDPDDLLPGDRDAIIMWLRASSYGTDFPITATDNETGTKFDTTINLRDLEYKKFSLKGDRNGFFDYKMPSSGDKIKFRFLTYGDVKAINKMEENETNTIKKSRFLLQVEELSEFINDDESLNRMDKNTLLEGLKPIRKHAEEIQEEESVLFTNIVTDRMEASIVSVNGITDREYISAYVRNMNIKDAFEFRKYIADNEPGVDFNIKIERPASLGGGSLTMFLSIDQYIFLNVS